MARLRLMSIYWQMIHDALKEKITTLEKENEEFNAKVLNNPLVVPYIERCYEYGSLNYGKLANYVGERKRVTYANKDLYVPQQVEIISELRMKIARYKAIDEKVVAASKKKDSFFDMGIGPDEPADYDDGRDKDEEFLAILNQID